MDQTEEEMKNSQQDSLRLNYSSKDPLKNKVLHKISPTNYQNNQQVTQNLESRFSNDNKIDLSG